MRHIPHATPTASECCGAKLVPVPAHLMVNETDLFACQACGRTEEYEVDP